MVGRYRPAFSERRPKPVLLPGSFCVPLRHRLSDLSRFHRPINIKLWQRKLIPLPRSYHLKCEVSRLNSWGPGVKKSDCNLQSGFSSIIVFTGSQAVRSFGKLGHPAAALAQQYPISLRQPVFRENVTAPYILSPIRLRARLRRNVVPGFSAVRRPINLFGVYIMSTEQVPNFVLSQNLQKICEHSQKSALNLAEIQHRNGYGDCHPDPRQGCRLRSERHAVTQGRIRRQVLTGLQEHYRGQRLGVLCVQSGRELGLCSLLCTSLYFVGTSPKRTPQRAVSNLRSD